MPKRGRPLRRRPDNASPRVACRRHRHEDAKRLDRAAAFFSAAMLAATTPPAEPSGSAESLQRAESLRPALEGLGLLRRHRAVDRAGAGICSPGAPRCESQSPAGSRVRPAGDRPGIPAARHQGRSGSRSALRRSAPSAPSR